MAMNWSNAISQAGAGLATLGFEGFKSSLEEQKIKLADELAEGRSVREGTRREEALIRAEGRAPTNAANVITAESDARANATVRHAPVLQRIENEGLQARLQTTANFANNPENIRAAATAEGLKKQLEAENLDALMKNPNYTKNLTAIALATDPDKAVRLALANAQSMEASIKLKVAQDLQAARNDLMKATKDNNKEGIDSARARIDALEYTSDKKTQQQTALAATMRTLQDAIGEQTKIITSMSPDITADDKKSAAKTAERLRANYDAIFEQARKLSGAKENESAGGDAAPVKPKTVAEVEALPDGTRFINPADGRVIVKQSGDKPVKDKPAAAPSAKPYSEITPVLADKTGRIADIRKTLEEDDARRKDTNRPVLSRMMGGLSLAERRDLERELRNLTAQ